MRETELKTNLWICGLLRLESSLIVRIQVSPVMNRSLIEIVSLWIRFFLYAATRIRIRRLPCCFLEPGIEQSPMRNGYVQEQLLH